MYQVINSYDFPPMRIRFSQEFLFNENPSLFLLILKIDNCAFVRRLNA